MTAPAFQFLRIHAHRASAAYGLLAEADRVPSHCSHIEHPNRPFWCLGSPEEVQRELVSFMRQPQPVRPKSGGVLYRKARSDLRCFMDCVASYPVETNYFSDASNDEKETLKDWVRRTHGFMGDEFGSHYVSSCIHSDESHPHLHCYIVGNASRLHPGLRAEFEDGRRISDGLDRIRRYRGGVRAFLDRYHSKVSCRYGHLRKGDCRLTPRISNRRDYFRFKESAEQSYQFHENELPQRLTFLDAERGKT